MACILLKYGVQNRIIANPATKHFMKSNTLVRLPLHLLAAVFSLAFANESRAAVINASSGSFAAVSAAVAAAAPGDTILIPPGTNIWTAKLDFSGVTLQGSGVNQTIIVDETAPVGNGSPLMQLSVNTNKLTRVTGIQFALGVTNKLPFHNYIGSIQVYGQSPLWRIDHCQFSWLTAKPIRVGDGSYGLIDHCSFLMNGMPNAIEIFDSGYGDVSWATPANFGSAGAVYVEDNTIFAQDNFTAIDVSNGGRAVIRNNVLNGAFFNTHGTETSQRFRSARYVEVYNNAFNYGGGAQYNNFYTACDLRGGTAVVFSNTFVGYWSVASINYYRASDNDSGFLPFFGATGLRGWDSNSPALLTGTATVTSNSLVVPGAGWTPNQWFGCTVFNNNNQLCGIVTTNTADKMDFKTSRRTWMQINFYPGDTYTVHRVYPMIDQPGMGQSDMLSGDSPNPTWLHFTPDPIYVWGNSLSIMYNVVTAAPAKAGSGYPNIKEGRDYINGTARPGYTPYQYPHPLTLITNAVPGTNTVIFTPPPTNTVVNPTLQPPTQLYVRPL